MQRSIAKKIGFSAAATVGFFILLELTLRLVSAGVYEAKVGSQNAGSGDDDAFRIVTFGDSVTAGQGTAPRYSYPKQLEELLREANPDGKFEVINQGVFALNSSRLARLLPGWIEEHDPDVVVVMSGCNNAWNYHNSHLEELGIEGLDVAKRGPVYRLLDNTQTYRFLRGVLKRRKAGGIGIAQEEGKTSELARGDVAPNLDEKINTEVGVSDSVRPAVDDQATTNENQKRILQDEKALTLLLEYDLDLVRQAAEEGGVHLVVMTYPFKPPYHDHHGITSEFAHANKVPLVDNFATFSRAHQLHEGLDLFSADRGHPNATGYRVVAAGIYDTLKSDPRFGLTLADSPDPLAGFKDVGYLTRLLAEVKAEIGRDPEPFEYRFEALGHIAMELDDLEEAEAAFRKAYEISDGAPQFFESLGTLLVKQNDWDAIHELKTDLATRKSDRNDIDWLLSLFTPPTSWVPPAERAVPPGEAPPGEAG